MEMEMEAGGSSLKRSRPVSPGEDEDGVGVDRISDLPDAVLGDIITLLPTKDGARTRILASRWRHLWRSAPLNLDCHDLWRSDDLDGIISRILSSHQVWRSDDLDGMVSRILSSHQGPCRRFCILRPQGGMNRAATTVDAWLRSPSLDNLQELDVSYDQHHPLSASTFRFSTTLRVVTIGGCDISDSTVQALHFPLLKQLGIEYVSISECSLHSLIASCPVLECLFLKSIFGFSCIRINSPTLKKIAISECGVYTHHSSDEIQVKELIIESAPCLEMFLDSYNFGLHGSVVSAPKLETLGFLSEGMLDVDGVDLSTRLVFGSTIIQGLRVDSLAMVVRTVKILYVNIEALNLDIVIELMRCFPCLEKLYLECWSKGENNLWRRKHRNLIRCLDIRLKTIRITTYEGFMSQVNFATFFVLNAKVLEFMIFEVSSTSEEFIAKQQKKLQWDNRASRGALFRFTTDRCLRSRLDINHVRDLDLADPFICRC